MSYLPYSSGGAFHWLAATGSSVAAHGAVLAVALGAFPPIFDLTRDDQIFEPEFTITLQQLDSDTLAGLIARDGVAGLDTEGLSDLDAVIPDAVEAETGEEIAALQPEQAALPEIPSPESIEPETAEEAPDPEEIAPLPEAETVEAIPEETLDPLPEAETVEATPEAETVEPLPEAETLEPLPEPETIEAQTADALDPLPKPETIGQQDSQPETVTPLRPAPELAAPVDANPLVSDRPTALLPETIESVAPLATSVPPVSRSTSLGAAPVQQADVVAVLPRESLSAPSPQATPERTTLQPAQPPAIAAARPQTPAPQPAPPPSAQDLAIGELLGRIRASPNYNCLIALPRRDGPDGVGLALIAESDREISDFVDTVLTAEDADIRQTRTFVDPRQCPALAYMRQNRDYPATRLGILLQQSEVDSGARIIGRVRGTAGKYVMLLLVDNNGVVQDLQRFVTFSGNTVSFNVPVNLVGLRRDTSHILMALATQRPLTQIRARSGQLAADVFANLQGELATNAALTLTTFDVR